MYSTNVARWLFHKMLADLFRNYTKILQGKQFDGKMEKKRLDARVVSPIACGCYASHRTSWFIFGVFFFDAYAV